MSFLAQLKVDGMEYNILDCSYSFHQETDHNRKPVGTARGGIIQLLLEASGKTNFLHWMISPTQTKDGSITFFKRDAMSRLYRIEFSKAYCIQFKEHFNAQNTSPLQTYLTLSARRMKVEDVVFENTWV
ncbi:type VI secretion system tube protein TssD [Sinomicrobium soli]|uniref:type VI secretion system tube protein TssD n=1 Tax=Sinomicrobium sp. N-1-3-6 TaxID=2219864 RepID=UPI000DCAFF33|nr:type VI secretion system tube protein TssD [Sinomicrobium sp. N-1-3-6]RAV27883.1 hypothetical protein DN748_16620 [Sinomicrobium sp. N-1-3-6]